MDLELHYYDENRIEEIIRQLTALNDICEVSSKQVLLWVQKVQMQRAQKHVMDTIKDMSLPQKRQAKASK